MLAVAVAACSSSGGSGKSAGASQAATATASSGSSGGTLDISGIDPAGLAKLSSEKVCTLLSAGEAEAILGAKLNAAPSGMLVADLGTNCRYTSGSGSDAAMIKVEFNTLGYKSQSDLLKYMATPVPLTIAGRPALGLEVPAVNAYVKAQVIVSMAADPQAVCLYIEAPTLAMAKQVAEKVTPRIAGLK
jgi:hypothetical protein